VWVWTSGPLAEERTDLTEQVGAAVIKVKVKVKLSLSLITHHAIKTLGGVGVYFHAFFCASELYSESTQLRSPKGNRLCKLRGCISTVQFLYCILVLPEIDFVDTESRKTHTESYKILSFHSDNENSNTILFFINTAYFRLFFSFQVRP